MNVTVLTYVEKEGSEDFDPVVSQVAAALRASKFRVKILGAHDDPIALIEGIRRQKPSLVFNLMEMFGRQPLLDVAAVGLLQLLCVRYTGGGPGEFYLQQDKALTKELLAFHGVPFPRYAVFRRDTFPDATGRLRFPAIVKPLRMEASMGIEATSLVRSTTQMMKRIVAIHEKIKDSALVEEFIEGREFYVGVMGNKKLAAFPPIEMDFSGLPKGMPSILGRRAKWVKSSREYKGTQSRIADVPEDLKSKLQKIAIDAYRALRVRDYGRIDMRLNGAGDVYVIEVNASCYLERDSEFATAAGAAGMSYESLINAIAKLALARSRLTFPF